MKDRDLSIWNIEDTPCCFFIFTHSVQFGLFVFYKSINGLTFYFGNKEIITGIEFIITYVVLSFICSIIFVFLGEMNLKTEIVAASMPVCMISIFNMFGRIRGITILYVLVFVILIGVYVVLYGIRARDAKKGIYE